VAGQRPIRDAGLALSLLTLVPTPARWPEEGGTQSAAWFPWVGGLVGLVGYGIAKAAEYSGIAHRAPLVLAVIIVSAWALLTRLLHWDGLCDVADGYWGSADPARRLEIMSDSHAGAFGVTAIVFVALLEVCALAAVLAVPHESPVLLVPMVARFAATAAAWLGTPARAGGLGRSVMGRPTALSILIAGAALGVAAAGLWAGFGVEGLVVGALGVALALGIPHVLSLRFGGVTGDVMGASVLLTEALLFATFALLG
jgi:adenosylcobinamide-GDP ribazoletransferase